MPFKRKPLLSFFLIFIFLLLTPLLLAKNNEKVVNYYDYIKFSLAQGEAINQKIVVSNNGNGTLEYLPEISAVDNFIATNLNRFKLTPGEKKELSLNIFSVGNQVPGIYTGKFIIKELLNTEDINIIKTFNYLIEVSTRDQFFDIDVKLERISAGNLPVIIDIKNIKAEGQSNIDLEIYVENINRDVIAEKSQKVNIKDSIKLTEIFYIGEDKLQELNELIIYAKVRYNGEVYIASTILKGNIEETNLGVILIEGVIKIVSSELIYPLVTLLVLAIVLTIFSVIMRNKHHHLDTVTNKNLIKSKYFAKGKKHKLHKRLYSEYTALKKLREKLDTIDKTIRAHKH